MEPVSLSVYLPARKKTKFQERDMLTETQIQLLLHQKSISDEWPWGTNDQREIDKHIQSIVAEVCRKLQLEEKTVYDHYGSGYASYVDCWFYRPDKDFRVSAGDDYQGLVVLLSRLSPYYVVGQGQKSWHKTGGAAYLPRFQFVDEIDHEPYWLSCRALQRY